MAREAVAKGARFKGAQKRINLNSKIINLKRENILTSGIYIKKILAQHLFKFNSLENFITVNYCLAFHTVDKEFFQFFVQFYIKKF